MSYQAIARKWRPRSFETIAGQGHVTRTLRNAIGLGRIHHAFLFTGARGVGKTSAARVLARCLNCEQGPTATPCGTCASCSEILTGNSPDVIEIDGASNNSVDDIRDLRDSVRYLPVRGRYKVYIVDEVHMLSKGAFNALLKTLEEPPPHVVFVFATTEAQKIPETILSRVQRFDFKRIPQTVVTERLQEIIEAEGVTIPDAGLRLIARAGEGSMRDAQSLLDQVISFGGNNISFEQCSEILGLVDRNLLYNMIEGLLKGDADPCLATIDAVYQYGYELSEFTSELLELLRNATLVGLSPSSKRYLDVADDERARLESMVKDVPSDVLVQAFQVMLDVHEQVSRSTRPRLVLEMAVARLVSIRPARPIEGIVDRLADLERRLRQGGAAAPRGGGGSGGSGGSGPGPRPGMRLDAEEPRRPEPMMVTPPTQPQAAPPAAEPFRYKTPPVEPIFVAEPPPAYVVEKKAPPPPAVDTPVVAAPITATPEPPVSTPEPPAPGGDLDLFRQLQDWLREQGNVYEQWAEDAMLHRVSAPELLVFFPDPRVLRLAGQTLALPECAAVINEGISRFFPGCQRARPDVRPDSSPLQSHREREAEIARKHLARLTEQLMNDPLILRAKTLLGAEIENVTAERRSHA